MKVKHAPSERSSSAEQKEHKRLKQSNVTMWNKDGSDFICLPQFHNTLPNAPSGPYLKNIELLHRYQDFSQYKTSSLEKNYVWQPHFGPDLGLRLDLVDQEAILNPINIRNEDSIDASEMRLLKGDAPERGRGKLRSLEGGEKPWWLRNTTYLENNLYSSVVQTKTEFKRQRVGTAFISGIESFIASFDRIDGNLQRFTKESREKFNLEVEWSIPVLPGDDFSNYFALARFDEDPDTTMNRPKIEKEKEKEIETDTEEVESVENQAEFGILANIRQSSPDEENTKTNLTSFFASLVLPSDEKKLPEEPSSTDSQKTEDALTPVGGEEETTTTVTTTTTTTTTGGKTTTTTTTSTPIDTTPPVYNQDTILYKWQKNYTMDVNTKQEDAFILTINCPSNSSSSASASSVQTVGSCTYHPVRSRLELKKNTDTDEHLAVVARRNVVE